MATTAAQKWTVPNPIRSVSPAAEASGRSTTVMKATIATPLTPHPSASSPLGAGHRARAIAKVVPRKASSNPRLSHTCA